jgi:hypothetical protein
MEAICVSDTYHSGVREAEDGGQITGHRVGTRQRGRPVQHGVSGRGERRRLVAGEVWAPGVRGAKGAEVRVSPERVRGENSGDSARDVAHGAGRRQSGSAGQFVSRRLIWQRTLPPSSATRGKETASRFQTQNFLWGCTILRDCRYSNSFKCALDAKCFRARLFRTLNQGEHERIQCTHSWS